VILQMNKEVIRVAIVGCGHSASFQANAVATLPGFEIVALCDVTPKHALLDLLPHIPTYGDIGQMLDRVECDIVSVCAPPRFHLSMAQQILERGVPVLMEKPVTTVRGDYDTLIDASRERGVPVFAALHAAFGVEVIWGKRQLSALFALRGSTITEFICEFCDPYCPEGDILSHAKGLGGSWLDSGINALSVLQQLIPLESLKVGDIIQRRQASFPEIDSRAYVRFHSNVSATRHLNGAIFTSWVGNRNRKRTFLTFSDGCRMHLDHSKQTGVIYDNNHKVIASANLAERDRLLEHYVGVFVDLEKIIGQQTGNIADWRLAHQLLYDAAERLNA
jgi:predicted dehydrogenase